MLEAIIWGGMAGAVLGLLYSISHSLYRIERHLKRIEQRRGA